MKGKSFEELLNELEILVKQLEAGEVPLDEAIKKYTEAMNLVKVCSDKITKATENVNKILTDQDELKNFEVEN